MRIPQTYSAIISHTEIDIDKDGFSYWAGRVSFKDCEAACGIGPGCVGWRDITAHPAYFEFAGDRRVIVTFPKPNWFDRLIGRDYFHAFQFKLKELGWRTFDLS